MSSLIKLFTCLLLKGDVVIDVNFGNGKILREFASIVGSDGGLVGLERSESLFNSFKEGQNEDIISRSLLINSKHASIESLLWLSAVNQPDDSMMPTSVSEVYYAMGATCPKLVKISSRVDLDDSGEVYSFVLNSLSVIEQCQSIFYLELSPSEALDPILDLFIVSDPEYRAYWFTTNEEVEESSRGVKQVLIVPGSSVSEEELSSFNLHLVTSLTANVESTTLTQIDEQSDSEVHHLITPLLVDGELLLTPYFSDVSVVKAAITAVNNPTIPFNSQLPINTLIRISESRCLVWTRRISSFVMGSTGSSLSRQHLLLLYESCAAFVSYRVKYTAELLHTRDVLKSSDKALTHSWSDMSTSYTLSEPFEWLYDEAACAEPLWCSHTLGMQERIRQWQFPDDNHATATAAPPLTHRTCANSKFLVFEPLSSNHGIGSMLELTASAFRFAICLNRILVLLPVAQSPSILKWRHPGCTGNVFECYFEPVSGCSLSSEDIVNSLSNENGEGFEEYPLRDERILVLTGLPNGGVCRLCYDHWPKTSAFFDGWTNVSRLTADYYDTPMVHAGAFMGEIKLTFTSQFLRFLMRPRPWFVDVLKETVMLSLLSPIQHSAHTASRTLDSFASLHVRFGNKVAEVALQPLSKYMSILRRKLPHFKDVFVSTETESVLTSLIREYPEYRFHFLQYPRIEYLVFGVSTHSDGKIDVEANSDFYQQEHLTYVREWLLSMANLYVSINAQGFVGSLSSNWCIMIHQLERTRGDGGFDYLSVDNGSAFTSCW